MLVLPFTNQSADREQDYFADNLASEISNLLGQVRGLRPLGDATSRAL
jgi:TolB-like protein